MDQPQTDFAAARNNMVDGQIRPNRVTDPRVLGAMRTLPREQFVPRSLASLAYVDEDLPLGDGRVLMEPLVIARLVQMARVRAGEQVLVVGAGTGYGAAVMAACGAQVTALEEDDALMAIALRVLPRVAPSVRLVEGRLAAGVPGGGPWDVDHDRGRGHRDPERYAAQLAPGGRLVTVMAPTGRRGPGRAGRAGQARAARCGRARCSIAPRPIARPSSGARVRLLTAVRRRARASVRWRPCCRYGRIARRYGDSCGCDSRLATVFGLGAACAAVRLAQTQPHTLQEALAAAYSSNPTLLAARAALRAVDEGVPQALAGWRPTVSSRRNTARRTARSSRAQRRQGYGTDNKPTLPGQATITQPLYRGGRTEAATHAAENRVLSQRGRLIATEQLVFTNVITDYVNVIQTEQLLQLDINNEQVLTRQLQATNDRFRVGEITRTDVAQAEAALAGARATRQTAEGNVQTARAAFQRDVGFLPDQLVAPQPLALPIKTRPRRRASPRPTTRR